MTVPLNMYFSSIYDKFAKSHNIYMFKNFKECQQFYGIVKEVADKNY